ncbi:MAG: Hydantoinase/oxoprolinase [Chloroflexi bacterium]|nr:Hydantoinase/oxoprolinase [Chloroflexota bacterium]
MSSTHPIYLGIDTGGTFTDGVLLDPRTRQVIKTSKVMTTHHDLKICVAQIIEQLVPNDPADIAMVSLSTTLATNAIAEGKRKPVALLLLGFDPELVHVFELEKQFATQDYFFVDGKFGINGVEIVPLDRSEIARIAIAFKDKVDAFAVASYNVFTNASHEIQAGEIISRLTQLPVVLAHQLSSELDSIRRATTASLNASLLSNLDEFLCAVQEMLHRHGIQCPVSMIRGDASIVLADYARKRPVEMIHSGPATSAIGGQFLSGNDMALVVDIGGTTTDISLVDQGEVQAQNEAATVGSYRTCVKTIKARSFGMGGDSLIRFDHRKILWVGPDRVIPLSYLCQVNPRLKQDLLDWIEHKKAILYSDSLEVWILRREPARPPEHPQTNRIIELLRNGPQLMEKIEKQTGPIFPLFTRELIDLEIIDRAGLTPTDILHVTGEFTPWDTEIARRVTNIAASLWEESAASFIDRVRLLMTRRLVAEIVQFLSNCPLPQSEYGSNRHRLDRWLFDENLNQQNPFLGSNIFLKVPMVGIGAPAKALLPAVAAALGTVITFPDHYEVANAIGAVAGNVMVRQEGEIYPNIEGAAWNGFFVQAGNVLTRFEQFGEARAYGMQTLKNLAIAEAQAAGAENIIAHCEEHAIWNGMTHLSAWAIGKPRLNGGEYANAGADHK